MLHFLHRCYLKTICHQTQQFNPTAGKKFPRAEQAAGHIKKTRNFKRMPLLMGWRLIITLHVFLFLHCYSLSAQQVSYCEPYSDRFMLRQEMLGKVGDYYWLSAITRRKPTRNDASTEERNFIVYDTRMNVSTLIPDPPYVNSSIKEYLVLADDHMDRLHLLNDGKQVQVRLQRYEPGGEASVPDHNVAVFPFSENGNSFMLVRSQDRTKILLLGFESVMSANPKVHALLFDQDWQLLSKRVYRHPNLTQPMYQDDYTSYPLEDYNNGPLKLADDGQWLMLAPSRNNHNFSLFNFSGTDTSVICKEINLPGTSSMEDVCLSIDNSSGDVVAGVLSTFHYSPLKNVEAVHYSMRTKMFSFDSSYRLTTLNGRRIRNENLTKENFIAVPGRGFLLLKEYGRAYVEDEIMDPEDFDQGYDPAFLFVANDIPDPGTGPSLSRLPSPHYGYARYRSTVNPAYHDRGDLSLYFFPASRKD